MNREPREMRNVNVCFVYVQNSAKCWRLDVLRVPQTTKKNVFIFFNLTWVEKRKICFHLSAASNLSSHTVKWTLEALRVMFLVKGGTCVCVCVCVMPFDWAQERERSKIQDFVCNTPTLISRKTFSHFTGLIGSFNHKPLWISPFKLVRCTNIFNRKYIRNLTAGYEAAAHIRCYCDRIPSIWVGKSGEIQNVSSKSPTLISTTPTKRQP